MAFVIKIHTVCVFVYKPSHSKLVRNNLLNTTVNIIVRSTLSPSSPYTLAVDFQWYKDNGNLRFAFFFLWTYVKINRTQLLKTCKSIVMYFLLWGGLIFSTKKKRARAKKLKIKENPSDFEQYEDPWKWEEVATTTTTTVAASNMTQEWFSNVP